MAYNSFRAAPICEPPVVRARCEHHKRRAVGNLVAQLFGDTHAAGRTGLAVENCQVDGPGIEVEHHHRFTGHFEIFEPRKCRVGVLPDCGSDFGARVRVAAVDEDAQRSCHEGDATSRFARLRQFGPVR